MARVHDCVLGQGYFVEIDDAEWETCRWQMELRQTRVLSFAVDDHTEMLRKLYYTDGPVAPTCMNEVSGCCVVSVSFELLGRRNG